MTENNYIHAHGSSASISSEEKRILANGLRELMKMTEGMLIQEFPSERYPHPLFSMCYDQVPEIERVIREINAKITDDPVSVLENGLVLLELFESNQPDAGNYFLEDMPFYTHVLRVQAAQWLDCRNWRC